MLNLDVTQDVQQAVASAIPELRRAVTDAVRIAVNDRLITVDEAAEVIRCSPGALRKRIARGALRAVRVGRTLRLRMSDLMGEEPQP